MDHHYFENIQCPTIQDALLAYTDAVGEDEANTILAEATKAVGVSQNTDIPKEVGLVLKYLADRPGLLGLYGTSLYVRYLAYAQIKKVQNPKSNGHTLTNNE